MARQFEALAQSWMREKALFKQVWNTLMPVKSKILALEVSRDLLLTRLTEQGVEVKLFYGLCPEFKGDKIKRFAASELLPKFIDARISSQKTCTDHDGRFITSQMKSISSQFPTNSTLTDLVCRRQQIIYAFLLDVLTVVNKYIAQQDKKKHSEDDQTHSHLVMQFERKTTCQHDSIKISQEQCDPEKKDALLDSDTLVAKLWKLLDNVDEKFTMKGKRQFMALSSDCEPDEVTDYQIKKCPHTKDAFDAAIKGLPEREKCKIVCMMIERAKGWTQERVAKRQSYEFLGSGVSSTAHHKELKKLESNQNIVKSGQQDGASKVVDKACKRHEAGISKKCFTFKNLNHETVVGIFRDAIGTKYPHVIEMIEKDSTIDGDMLQVHCASPRHFLVLLEGAKPQILMKHANEIYAKINDTYCHPRTHLAHDYWQLLHAAVLHEVSLKDEQTGKINKYFKLNLFVDKPFSVSSNASPILIGSCYRKCFDMHIFPLLEQLQQNKCGRLLMLGSSTIEKKCCVFSYFLYKFRQLFDKNSPIMDRVEQIVCSSGKGLTYIFHRDPKKVTEVYGHNDSRGLDHYGTLPSTIWLMDHKEHGPFADALGIVVFLTFTANYCGDFTSEQPRIFHIPIDSSKNC